MILRVLAGILIVSTAIGQETNAPQRNRLVFPSGATEPTAPSTPTPAQPRGTSDPTAAIEVFFLALKADQVDAAYDELMRGSLIGERKDDVLALKNRTKDALDEYGPVRGYEVVNDLTLGAHLLRRTCVSLNTDLPLRWRFYFYKSEGSWRLVDLRVDDALIELFDEAAKLRR